MEGRKGRVKEELTKIAMQEQEQNDIEKSRKKRIATGQFSRRRKT